MHLGFQDSGGINVEVLLRPAQYFATPRELQDAFERKNSKIYVPNGLLIKTGTAF